MTDRYLDLIDRIVTATLKGQIRSKVQVYKMLQAEVEPGTGELFERCLTDQVAAVDATLADGTDELKQAKAMRKQRALKTIQGEWEQWQKDNQANSALTGLIQGISQTVGSDRLGQLVQAMDPNQPDVLSRDQLRQLSRDLQQLAAEDQAADSPRLLEMAEGLTQGLTTWQQLEGDVISWLYEQGQQSLGFGNTLTPQGPWSHWGKRVSSSYLKRLFADLAEHQSVTEAGIPVPLSVANWIELAITLQRLQLGLVAWFDKQPYDPKAGKRLSISTFLTFAVVWSQLSNRFRHIGQSLLADACFQMALQALYQFAQQDYFPLYGGLFAALSGESLRTLLDYLDQPLRQVPNTATKARVLTLLGYSQRALGRYGQALQFHQRALESARAAQDQRCEIANLNHLSRTAVMQKDYDRAISESQHALILARQAGDRLGEANALASYGYSQVYRAQEQSADLDQIESVLTYLEQGLQLSEQLHDRPSQALCANSLGIALTLLQRYEAAVSALEKGLHIAQAIGDMFLQGLNYTYLATAYMGLDNPEMAVFSGNLAMYLLYQINSEQWRQPAGTLSVLYGQIGAAAYQTAIERYRAGFLKQIGVDGYEYLAKLLAEYRQSLE